MVKASLKERREAEAARTLAWMAMRMPSWPTVREKAAPRMKAMERPMAMMSWVFLGNSWIASRLGGTI